VFLGLNPTAGKDFKHMEAKESLPDLLLAGHLKCWLAKVTALCEVT